MNQCTLICFHILVVVVCYTTANLASRVIYAVNAGGGSHIDSYDISYLADPLDTGVSSDYGRRLPIQRVAPKDNILYQTERWHDRSFAYEVPVKEDGDYVLVLKFAEVYFYGPNQKVFNVQLNNQHLILRDLDIFSHVGHSTAHDESIPFSIKKGKLSVLGEYSTFNGILKIEFLKGEADNPKICAFYLMKGVPSDVPRLPNTMKSHPEGEDEVEDDMEEYDDDMMEMPHQSHGSATKSKFKSGPPAVDPYAEDSSSLVMPIVIAFAVFIPTLVCMCRL